MAASDRMELARHALEQVCSGSDASAAVGVYSPDFHDHVNASEYRGYDGIRRSLGLYQLVFSDGDLSIRVEDQVSEGERVASRWVAEGHNRGRPIRIWGIVISRIEDGEIVEDWAASDNLHLIRQLGPRRILLLGLAWLRSKRG
ncbi:MAG TPA: ester cyclase [Thermoleophilaceae bacterium]